MEADFTEAWEVNHRVNMMILEALDAEALEATYAPRVRNVGRIFAHLHNARLMWLEVKLPKGVGELQKFGKDDPIDLEGLKSAHSESTKAMQKLWTKISKAGKMSGFKRSPQSFFSYLMAHEAHHRGQIMVALRLSGIKLPQELKFGLWAWDKLELPDHVQNSARE